MKNIINNLVVKERKVKQKVKKMKYNEDGKLRKVIERETEYEDNNPDHDLSKES